MNNPEALFIIGKLYHCGMGVEINYNEARRYYEMAAKLNNSNALNNLGNLYNEGLGVNKDLTRAIKYYKESAKLNNRFACYNLGNNNIPIALYELGKLYLKGRGVEKNINQAIEYFIKSGQNNYEKAFCRLGVLYLIGKDVEQNFGKAKEYLISSAMKGYSKAIYFLGYLYFKIRDFLKARENFIISSQKNDLEATYYLGLLYENGMGVEKNILKAIEYYKQCVTNKESRSFIETNAIDEKTYVSKIFYNHYYYPSNNNLGLIYITESDHENLEFAEYYLKEAGFNEYQVSQNNYGILCQFYLNKIENAKYFYKKASKNHFALSEFNLGHICEEERKCEDAMEHYKMASEYEYEPIIFHQTIIEDERLEISKTFIICYTNLKISQFYLSQYQYHDKSELCDSYKFFLKAIFSPLFNLILYSISNSYAFNFKIKLNGDKCIITNLRDFIFNNPLYHGKNNFSNSQNISASRLQII